MQFYIYISQNKFDYNQFWTLNLSIALMETYNQKHL